MNTKYLLPILTLGFMACEPVEIELPEENGGSLNLASPVILMDEMGSGFRDFELYRSGQESSIAQLLSNQIQASNSGDMRNGLMLDEVGLGNRRKLGYTIDCNGDTFLFAIPFGGMDNPQNSFNVTSGVPFDVIAIPGLSISDLDNPNFANENPYYNRITTGLTVTNELLQANPSSYFLWLGMSDIYDYARAGATGTIPSASEFENDLEMFLTSLNLDNGSGAIATVPDLIDAPFFNLVAWNALDIDADQSTQLNLLYAINPDISFEEGPNGFVYQEGVQRTQMQEGEKVMVTVDLDAVKCDMYGSLNPFVDADVLSLEEITEIKGLIAQYNSIIRQKANEYGMALVEMDPIFNQFDNGNSLFFDGIEVSAEFGSGGFYSVDGLNPTGRGSAIIVNAYIQAVNAKFGANIPLVTVAEYPGVFLPLKEGL